MEDNGCIKEKCLECKKFITVVDMKTHLEVCKEAKRLLDEEKEKEYIVIYLTMYAVRSTLGNYQEYMR